MTDELSPTTPSAPSAPSERARIEPTTPHRRVDALPVLYLAGFLILAGSLVYIWRHPSLPSGVVQQTARVDTIRQELDSRGKEVADLSARLARLENSPAPAAPDLGPLDTRLKALETRPAPAAPPAPDLKPIETRLAAVEARPLPVPPPPPVNLGPLETRVGTLEARRPVDLSPLENRVAAVEARRGPDLSPLEGKAAAAEQRLAELNTRLGALDPRLAALDTRIAAVDAAGKQTATGLAAITDRAQRSQRLITASAALDSGQRLGDIPGAPPALARFAQNAPPTDAALRLSFNAAADAAHRASQPAITDNQPLLDRMWTRAQQSVTVRQGERVIVGDPIAGVLASARTALDAGDLSGAVKALAGLAGPARAAMADWIDRAQSLLDARAALAEMAAR